MWVEVGHGRWSDRVGGSAEYRRNFEADLDTGVTQAAVLGYVKGATIQRQGQFLRLTGIEVTSANNVDFVSIIYQTQFGTVGGPARGSNAAFLDDINRKNGDEEWVWEFDHAEKQAKDCVNWEGKTYAEAFPNLDPTVVLPQCGCVLIGRKWFNTNTAGPDDVPVILPNNKADALAAIGQYLPGENGGGYETGDSPKMMHVLDESDLGQKFVCIDVRAFRDGDLLCREARYLYRQQGWPGVVYKGGNEDDSEEEG